MAVPFLGRLNVIEYVALIGSFLLVSLEAIIRVLTLALPTSIVSLLYGVSRRLFNRFASPEAKRAESRRKSISSSIRDASDFVDLCALHGYTAEEHVVQTEDGYLLGLHRLAWQKGEEDVKVNSGPGSVEKRVVYLHHGLLMNSEVWVCLTDADRTLPFVLVDRGFDVWLGNNRGNKYSKKSVHYRPTSTEFWNFSIDDFAFLDIPNSIKYVLETAGQKSLSYIGFSQGTAQALASLAVHPKLNRQVNVFIGLAPALSPPGLANGIVDALVKASPQVLFLLFGRRSILSSVTMWQSVLYPPLFCKAIEMALGFLFNWRTRNIATSQKLAAYPHLYSFTSVKSVVHWFQIIRTKSFQMYDDDVAGPPLLAMSTSSKYTRVARYPTRNIKTPVVLVYGGSDSLVDIRFMLRELPRQTVATEIPHYEHLDFLWARDVDAHVFPHVFDALESFTEAEHTKEEFERFRSARYESLTASRRLDYKSALAEGAGMRRDGVHLRKANGAASDSDMSTALGGGSCHEADGEETPVEGRAGDTAHGGAAAPVTPANTRQHQARESQIPTPRIMNGVGSGIFRSPRPWTNRLGGNAPATWDDESFFGGHSNPSSSDPHLYKHGAIANMLGGGGSGAPHVSADMSPPAPDSPSGSTASPAYIGGGSAIGRSSSRRRPSGGSSLSLSDSLKGGRGISLGASRAVGGLMTEGVEAAGLSVGQEGSSGGGGGGGAGSMRRKGIK